MSIGLKWFSILLFVLLILGACEGTPTSTTKMTFETIGSRGAMRVITLTSPGPDDISPRELANRLRDDWQNRLEAGNMIIVFVFDNKEAPLKWLEVLKIENVDRNIEAWERAEPEIYPHHVATYWRNKTSGLHEVNIYSRDEEGRVVQTFDFSQQ